MKAVSGRQRPTMLACLALLVVGAGAQAGPAAQLAPGAGPADRAFVALTALRAALEERARLSSSLPDSQPTDPDQAAMHVQWLQNSIPRAATGIPQIAIDGVNDLTEALRASPTLTPEQQAILLERVHEDLELKATYCRTHPDGMAALIPLTVRTWSNDAFASDEVRRWNVFYLSAPLAVLGERRGDPFPRFSSPTTTNLPPGRYVIWAQDPNDDSRRGPERMVTIGDPALPVGEEVTADLLVAAK